MPVQRVLFVCIGNSCRSQMAEALARHRAPDVIEASSAGLFPLGYLTAQTRAVLAEAGVPCDGQTSKPLRVADVAAVDLVINLSGQPAKNLFDAKTPPVEDWNVGDPFGSDPQIYRRVCDAIERRVAELAERLRTEGAAR